VRPNTNTRLTRRHFLARISWATGAASFGVALWPPRIRATSAPLLDPKDPGARAVRYVEDAKRAKEAAAGSTCASCALYQGTATSRQGPCQLFPGKEVKAAGWCASWAPQM
jgi:hypothetical protein